ncbi:MAG: hypothetical protein NUV65_00755 [Candidatus Roizmanbacteria bacterium]|nr:hypothetical protein [Candidatus Roizmanbacteria bacterium]
MGYMVELNTLLGFPKDFDVNTLKVGGKYAITKDRERAFPLHIALLMVDSQWNFYGYCVAHSAVVKEQKTQIDFEVLSLFSAEEKKIYKDRFLEAAKSTGEVKR